MEATPKDVRKIIDMLCKSLFKLNLIILKLIKLKDLLFQLYYKQNFGWP